MKKIKFFKCKIFGILSLLFILIIIYIITHNEDFNLEIHLHINKIKKYSDREIWVNLAYKIAFPVLDNMSKGQLKKNMLVEYSDSFFSRDKRVLFLECFGRLMAGISPWLVLPDDSTKEGKIRKQLRELALLSYQNAVDPNSPDMLLWNGTTSRQPLVDAAYLAQSFLQAPSLWNQLNNITKQRYIECFQEIRKIHPYRNNWLLFSGLVECFFIMAGIEPNKELMYNITDQINKWYVGDGWYSDGDFFAMNYYNSYVIHPMFILMLEIMEKNQINVPISSKEAIKRMQRFNQFLERLISPEGKFPAFGRSIVYRLGIFQTLSLSIWKYGLPEPLTNGGVRSALTSVINNMFSIPGNFNKGGYLTLGFAGHQINIANGYSNNGSTYITALIFLALGLPENHPFWTEPSQSWTSQNAWRGKEFAIDNHINL